MSVAAHLGINVAEYDARIRTFIPDYEEMIDVAAGVIPGAASNIVDLGVGTGAFSAACLRRAPQAKVLGVDMDEQILKLAAARLGDAAEFTCASFVDVPLPPCDVIIASFALHHVRKRTEKGKLHRRILGALRPGGVFVSVDCHPAEEAALAVQQHEAWKAHLRLTYSDADAQALLDAWSHEDFYVPLKSEVGLMERAGFAVEVLWRRGEFAVVMGKQKTTE
jgi:tRNA (cmo5U34)-methyltransferase